MIIRAILSVFVIICLSSCADPANRGGSETNPDNSGKGLNRRSDDSISHDAVNSHPSARDMLPGFKTLDTVLSFAGVWVNEIYFDSIAKNRSPRLDQGIMSSCITIPDSTLEATSMIGGFHDGGGTMVVVKDGNRYQFYNPQLTSPLDTIEPLLPTRLRIGNQYFRPLRHPDTDKNDWGILEEILFSGKYQKEDGKEVVFGTDGHVTGLGGLSYYEPVIDYADRADRQVDRISLGQSHKKLDDYGFRFDKDTLLIYRIDCLRYNAGGHKCDSARLGELMWVLRKMPGQ